MKIIKCGSLSINMLLLFLIPVISCLISFAETYLNNINLNLNQHPFILQITICLLEFIIGGILVLISKYKSKRRNIQIKTAKDNCRITPFIFELLTENKSVSRMFNLNTSLAGFILLQIIMYFLVFSSTFYYSLRFPYDGELLSKFTILQIILNGFISIRILKLTLHKHHYFAIGLLGLSFILVSFQCITHDHQLSFWSLYIFVHSLLWAVIETNAKWIMKTYDISPYVFLFMLGLGGIVVQLILAIPISFIPCNMDFCTNGRLENYIKVFQIIFNSSSLIITILLYVCCFTLFILLILIVNNAFNPTHSCTAESFENIALWLYNLFLNNTHQHGDAVLYIILSSVGYCVLVFGGLIYNEIIVCNVCALDKSTREAITQRADEDLHLSVTSFDNII